jgi:MFS transporter, DHA2 family, multidrug resistance protein
MSAQAVSAGAPAKTGASVWMIGILLATANFLAVLDVTIANVSVQNISGDLGVSGSQGAWVITSYAVAEAISVPLTGWLAKRFGAVRVFVTAMVAFGVFSALCGLSNSLGMLVLFRVLQGLAGGPLLPLSQTLLMHIFPKKQLPAAMALWVVTTLTAPVAGPILGGWLCDNFGWPSIFWVNVPIALICAPIIFGVLRAKETEVIKAKVDVVGLVLLVVWVGALQLILDLGKEHEWFASPMIVGLGVISLVGFAAFLIWELTEKDPIVSLRVFASPGFAISALTMGLGYAAFMGANVLTPNWLQSNMGYTATQAGMACSTLGVMAIIAAPIAAKLVNRVDVRLLVFLGLAWLAAVSFMRAGTTSDITFGQISLLVFVMGAGMPFFFLPLNTLALSSIDERETAGGAGLMNFIRTVSGAFATSMVNTAWEDGTQRKQEQLSGLLNGAQSTIDGLMAAGHTDDQALSNLTRIVQSQAVMLATNELMMIAAAAFLFAGAAIWLAPKPARVAEAALGH